MKYIILAFALCFVVNLGIGQGTLGDLMSVEAVSIDLTKENEELISKYDETLTKESSELDNALVKIDEAYQSNVSKLINDFSKILKEGKQEIVSQSKSSIVTKIKSLTMTHRTSKKKKVQDFLNNMQLASYKLPKFMKEDSATEVKETASTHFETFETDYTTNMNSIKAFQDQEHLIVIKNPSTAAN